MMNYIDKFYYFAYGSNMLKERIQFKNPSAMFICSGILRNFKLGFFKPVDINNVSHNTWNGGVASILPSESDHVYGSVWELNKDNLDSLDRQEGVPLVYFPIEVEVEIATGKIIICRSYRLHTNENSKPSPYYLDIILRGAYQCSLPTSYVDNLLSTEHNGNIEPCHLYWQILKSSENLNITDFKVEILCDSYADLV